MPQTGSPGLALGQAHRPLTPEGVRTHQLGTALARMARDLAEARREARALQRENAVLRRQIIRLGGESR
jgi:hypothetical protein